MRWNDYSNPNDLGMCNCTDPVEEKGAKVEEQASKPTIGTLSRPPVLVIKKRQNDA